MTDSPLLVGYTGAEGAYAHQAALQYHTPLNRSVTYRAFLTFREMLAAVRDGEIDSAVLPIENTTAGSINESYDLLSRMDLAIVGEEIQEIDHCLLAISNIPLNEIRRIYSHPQALAQCSEFLASMPWCSTHNFGNTALAAMKVAEDNNRAQAAIASERAAILHHLTVIARDIADQPENFTRFVIVGAKRRSCESREGCKTSVMFVTKHERGALVACLGILSERGLNLTKLESRPRAGAPWEYQFYVDFEGNADDPNVAAALKELTQRTSILRVFGSYHSRTSRSRG